MEEGASKGAPASGVRRLNAVTTALWIPGEGTFFIRSSVVEGSSFSNPKRCRRFTLPPHSKTSRKFERGVGTRLRPGVRQSSGAFGPRVM